MSKETEAALQTPLDQPDAQQDTQPGLTLTTTATFPAAVQTALEEASLSNPSLGRWIAQHEEVARAAAAQVLSSCRHLPQSLQDELVLVRLESVRRGKDEAVRSLGLGVSPMAVLRLRWS